MSKRIYYNGRFEQRSRTFVSSAQGLPSPLVSTLCFTAKDTLYAGTQKGLVRVEGHKAAAVSVKCAGNSPISMLFCDSADRVWGATDRCLFTVSDKKSSYAGEFDKPIVAMGETADKTLWLLTEDTLYKCPASEKTFTRVIDVPGIANCMAVTGEKTICVGTQHSGLLSLIGKRPHWAELFKQFTGLLSNRVNALSFDSTGMLWVGTDKGVCVYDGRAHWLSAAEVPALPKGCINDMVFGTDGARWFATTTGVVLLKDGVLKYYGYKRWVPDPDVRCVALSTDGTMCAGTNDGLSFIETAMMTLEEKAAHYQKTVEKYHVRCGGFVTVRFLDSPGDMDTGYVEVSDNDGTWTAMYMAAQCYRYGATKDKEALALARRTFKALMKLTTVTGIPGFTARAIRYPGERGYGDGDPEWHLEANGDGEWKCETSSDEMVGDFYGLSAYYDIVADDKEKTLIADTVRAIMDHILENNFKLVDYDGLPTTWANWAPEDLNYNNHWHAEKGQNSLELLSMLKTTFHMTGDDKYNEVYRRMITEHHYLMNTMHYKVEDYYSCHIDDELGMLTITPLLKYEKDPIIRSYLMLGFTRHWQYERIERTPLWTMIYGSLTGRHCDIEVAAESLELLPLDLIHWQTFNSHREDLEWVVAATEFWMPPQLKEPLPFDEKPTNKYDANPFHADHDVKTEVIENEDGSKTVKLVPPQDGAFIDRRVEDGTVFLHPYWMGRYYGLLGD